MLRPPPTSTLFPYTTLFRSRRRRNAQRRERRVPREHHHPRRQRLGKIGDDAALRAHALAGGNPLGHRFQDRKSTRLNSSHGYISYAVFCLKKKNNQRQTEKP